MRVAVTGSAGHLGEGIVRALLQNGHHVVSVDSRASPYTTNVGSVIDVDFMTRCLSGSDAIIHTAALHKRHLQAKSPRDFLETNILGTNSVLEAALRASVSRIVYTSSTSVYGAAFKPKDGAPAVMVDESLPCVPKDIYGMTKKSAEDLCELFARTTGLSCIVLRVGRFYPEKEETIGIPSDEASDLNHKVNDLLYRRVDLGDAVHAHLLAAQHRSAARFSRYVVSATSPFTRHHLVRLRTDAAEVVRELFPHYKGIYEALGWSAPQSIGRVYCNELARHELGWVPRYDFEFVLNCLRRGTGWPSQLALQVGIKGYGDPADST